MPNAKHYDIECGTDAEGVLCLLKYHDIQIGYVEKLKSAKGWSAFLTLPRGATGDKVQQRQFIEEFPTRAAAVDAIAAADSENLKE